MLKFLLKATVLVALVSGAFFGGYVIGVFDQESSVAWREASYTASALREIREKRPERAMLLLETRLDYHLLLHAQFDTSPHRISRRMRPFPEEAMRDGIKNAAQYRIEFPSPAPDERMRALIESAAQRYR